MVTIPSNEVGYIIAAKTVLKLTHCNQLSPMQNTSQP